MTATQRNISPALRRHRLAMELRRLRGAIGSGLTQVEDATGVSKSRLQRIEVGRAITIRAEDMNALLDLYGITDEATRERLSGLARDSSALGWWSEFKDVFGEPTQSPAVPDLENEAGTIQVYEGASVPPLLQTEDYAEAMFWRLDGGERRRHVQGRMERRQLLTRLYPPTYVTVIDESVLHRVVVSPAVMEKQLGHLAHMAGRPDITVHVLPLSNGAVAASSAGFTLLDYPEPLDDPIVHAAPFQRTTFVSKIQETALYRRTWEVLVDASLDPDASLALINEVRASMAARAAAERADE